MTTSWVSATTLVRSSSQPSTCAMGRARVLKDLMTRDDDETHAQLERHLRGLRALLPKRYGESLQVRQTLIEVDVLLDLPRTHDALQCKRAALLFALGREREVSRFFDRLDRAAGSVDGPRGFALDLAERVLPLTTPLFLRNCCQSPDGYVLLNLVLAELWAGERLGNWPRRAR